MNTETDLEWGVDETVNFIEKKIVEISSFSNIKYGSTPYKQPEEVSADKIKEIMEKKINCDNEFNCLCDCKLITESLTKYLNDVKKINFKDVDISQILTKLEWVKKICLSLSEKKGLSKIIHMPDDYAQKKSYCILRNSYNFCDNSYECKYYYNKSRINSCNKQHFVYNYLLCDLNEITKYILETQLELINFEEVLKSIKTLNFVTEHMKNEIDCRNKNLSTTINKSKKFNSFGKIDFTDD